MPVTKRGEVWLADFGLVAKIRPVVVISIAPADVDRALVVVIPHTTSTRASRFEVVLDVPFLKPGAFDAQNLAPISTSKLIRRLGRLSDSQLASIVDALRIWLGLS